MRTFALPIALCLGLALAREEANVALRSVLGRLGDISLAVEERDLAYKTNPIFRALERLPKIGRAHV